MTRGDDSDPIERIRRLCDDLVEIAPWWEGWWTPVSPQHLAAFEAKHRVILPIGYRRLLREIGDRAPIPGRPHGGLLSLNDALCNPTTRALLGPLDQAFLGTGADGISLEWDDDADEYVDPHPLSGCLPIVDGGCDLVYLLVVTGADRERVWRFSPSGAPQLEPTRANFLDWYVAQFERGLEPLRTEAEARRSLEQRVADNPDDLAASLDLGVELGKVLLLRDRPRARALLDRAWASRESLAAESRTKLHRAVAQLDLLDGRGDRIEELAASDDDELRTYAGIHAARIGDFARAIERLESVAAFPVLLRAAATGWLAAAHAALGRPDHALSLLRSTQASASNHALAARLRTQLGERDAALRSWREARATIDRARSGPRPPMLADLVELPIPSAATIDAALAELDPPR